MARLLPIADADSLALKLETVRNDRRRLEKRLARLQVQIAELRRSEVELANEMHRVRIQPSQIHTATSLPSRRSIRVLRAWAALERAFLEASFGADLSQHAAQRAIVEALPGTPPGTIRSYLHRFKAQGLITRSGTHWQLASRVGHAREEDKKGGHNG